VHEDEAGKRGRHEQKPDKRGNPHSVISSASTIKPFKHGG
jgi:hypothetical protein